MKFQLGFPVTSVHDWLNHFVVYSTVFPSMWKRANVTLVPKVATPVDITKDLRPISLTPTVSKVLESFVGQWKLDELYGKLDGRQYGALKGRSTTHELVDILHH